MSNVSSQDILNELTVLKNSLNKLNSKYYGPFQSPHSSVSNLSNSTPNSYTVNNSSPSELSSQNHSATPDPPLEINNTTLFPFILLLGNHSAGKSSFINQLFNNKEIQETSLAPLDDCFTVISSTNSFMKKNSLSTILENSHKTSLSSNNNVPEASPSVPINVEQSSSNIVKSGEILINDPDLGFKTLKQFGKRLVDHTKLKLINSSGTDFDFMVVDTPGMIDSVPTGESSASSSSSSSDSSTSLSPAMMEANYSSYSRGYDFPNVVNWYAERADVILLFFDPEKPGTTFETLKILKNSLRNHEEKLFFILNKIDNLKNLNDLLRVYGTLTWNLSKVLIQKELPKIFTICLNKNLSGEAEKTNLLSNFNEFALEASGNHLSSEAVEYNPEVYSSNSSSLATPNSLEKTTQENSLVAYEPVNSTPLAASTSSLVSNYFSEILNDLTKKNYNNVLNEIFNAPKKRLDNEINYFHDIFLIFFLHYKLFNKIAQDYKRKLILNYKKYFYLTLCSCVVSYGAYNLTDYLIQYNNSNDKILTKLLTNNSSGSVSESSYGSSSFLSTQSTSSEQTSFFNHFKQNFLANLQLSASLTTLLFSQVLNSLNLLYNNFKTNNWLNQFTEKKNHKILIHRILIDDFSPSPSTSTLPGTDSVSATDSIGTSSSPASPVVLTDFTPYIIDKALNNVTLRLTPKLFKTVKIDEEAYENDKKFLENILYEDIPKIRRKILNFNSSSSRGGASANLASPSFQGANPPDFSPSSSSSFLNFSQAYDIPASSPTASSSSTSFFSSPSVPNSTTTTTTTTFFSRVQSSSPLKDISSAPFLNVTEPPTASSSSYTTNASPTSLEIEELEELEQVEVEKDPIQE